MLAINNKTYYFICSLLYTFYEITAINQIIVSVSLHLFKYSQV